MNKVHRRFWSKNDQGKTPRVGETSSSERAISFIKFQASGKSICSRNLNTQQKFKYTVETTYLSFPQTNFPGKCANNLLEF
jgi:hypothetical protein